MNLSRLLILMVALACPTLAQICQTEYSSSQRCSACDIWNPSDGFYNDQNSESKCQWIQVSCDISCGYYADADCSQSCLFAPRGEIRKVLPALDKLGVPGMDSTIYVAKCIGEFVTLASLRPELDVLPTEKTRAPNLDLTPFSRNRLLRR